MSEHIPGGTKGPVAEAKTPNMYESSTDIEKGTLVKVWRTLVTSLFVETQGNEPIPPERQTDRRYYKLFTLWFSMNFNLLS
jgi:hypothetical protein